MFQLSLSFQHDQHFLKTLLEKQTRRKISLVVTDNTSTMLSMRAEKDGVSVRLHWIFLSAKWDVIAELAGFISNTREKTPLIRNFIDQNIQCLKEKSPKKVRVRTQGTYYHLLDIYHALNREYFEGRVSASITWGTRGARRTACRRTLGSYSSHNNMIRINPLLDARRVPRYFLESVIYHEMLHADMGIEREAERRTAVHSKEFIRRERQFRHYERALSWEKRKL
jgi:predicted SprT family Zn-dependent metalloprotease